MKLSESLNGRSQNLHFIRFIAAILVIYGHAYPISGCADAGLLSELTNGRLNFRLLAVSIFFLVGGFLIAKSIDRLKSASNFFKARIFRIFPPLILVIVSTMLLGVFFTEYSAKKYFTDINTWKYLLNCVFVLVHNLPGVFAHNPYLPTVNGSLWTLPVEFICYIACFMLYKGTGFDKKGYMLTVPIALLGLCGGGAILASRIPLLGSAIRPCLLFYIGIGYYVFRDKIELKVSWMVLACFGFIASVMLNATLLGFVIFFPYIIFVLCFGVKQVPPCIGKLGNYSYGMYLWGFPVQQAVVQIVAGGNSMNVWLNFAISLPVSIVLGMLTYYVVEARLAYKV